MAKERVKKKYQVFLSYSRQDLWISQVMKEKMEALKGVKVWLDAFDLPGGANIKERIKQGMREPDECLILLSPASKESAWVRHEAGLADGLDRWITLLLSHVTRSEVPDPLRELNHLSINDFASYLDQLKKRAKGKGLP